jgi:ribonuclease P protein component
VARGTIIPGRLRRDRDVRRVLTEGRRWQDRRVALRALQCRDDTRIEFAVVATRAGGRATARNRVKRWVREDLRDIIRTHRAAGGWWLAVIVRSGAMTSDHAAVRATLRRLLCEAGVTADEGTMPRSDSRRAC